jgi:chemotaxis protein CheD
MTRPPVAQRFLQLGNFYFGAERVRVHTVLGTCIAITLWHPIKRLGGICHYLLPTRGAARAPASGLPGVYADEVMELIEASLRRSQTRAEEYQVKLFGGGNMFPEQLAQSKCRGEACTDLVRARCTGIGCRNIAAGQRLIAEHGFTIAARDVGGHGSRQVSFDVWSGDVWVRRGAPVNEGLPA